MDENELIALLLQQLMAPNEKGEVSPGQNRALDAIFDPRMGMATGGFDYMSAVPPSFEPQPFDAPPTALDRFESSGDEIYAEVARMIREGFPQATVNEAVRAKLKETGASDDFVKDVISDVGNAYKEFGDVQAEERKWNQAQQEQAQKARQEWEKDTPWGQAGLPNPTDTYTPDLMAGEGARGRQWDDQLEALARQVESASVSTPDAQVMLDRLAQLDQNRAARPQAEAIPSINVSANPGQVIEPGGTTTDQYASTIAPLFQDYQQGVNEQAAAAPQVGGAISAVQQALAKAKGQTAPQGGGGGTFIDRLLGNVREQAQAAVGQGQQFEDLSRRVGQRDADYRQLQSFNLQQQGRNPFMDALQQRLGMR